MGFRFKDEWQCEPMFQNWLLKVSNDSARAYCRFCEVVLRAHRGDLTGHAATQKHNSNTQKWASENQNTQILEPVNVQIVMNMDALTTVEQPESQQLEHHQEQITGDEDFRPHEGTTNSNNPEESEEEVETEKRHVKASGGKRYGEYIKRYRPVWEDEEEFKGWLASYPDDASRAFCKACKSILRAHKHDISCHGRTLRHQKNLEKTRESNGENLFEISTHLVGLVNIDDSETKAVKLGIVGPDGGITVSSEDHHHQDQSDMSNIEILPDPTINQNDESIEPKPKIIRLSKAILNKEKTTPRPRKRIRFNASDVVQSIANNEFTGYELLQIVKAAVPKL